MSDLFCPDGAEFHPVSPQLRVARIVVATIWLGIIAVVAAVLAWKVASWIWVVAGGAFAVWLWLMWLIPRQVRALQWATTDTDFIIRRGIMFRSMVVVPFGRIQYADVQEGPLDRYLKIAGIKVNTASPSTEARLPGLTPEDASSLRDLLVANGQSELSGL